MVTSVVVVVVWLSFGALCTIIIGTGCELYKTIFLWAGKIPFVKYSMDNVPSSTGTARFLKVLNMTRIQVARMCTWSIIVPMNLNFWFVALLSGFSLMRIELIQSGLTVSSVSWFSPAPVSQS